MYSKARGQERSCVNSTPQLTHVDLGPRNILIKNERIAAIVDWETYRLRCHRVLGGHGHQKRGYACGGPSGC